MIKIDGNNNLIRDEENMAVINTDTSGLNRAKLLKRRITGQDTEINTLKEEVNEIKELLLRQDFIKEALNA